MNLLLYFVLRVYGRASDPLVLSLSLFMFELIALAPSPVIALTCTPETSGVISVMSKFHSPSCKLNHKHYYIFLVVFSHLIYLRFCWDICTFLETESKKTVLFYF